MIDHKVSLFIDLSQSAFSGSLVAGKQLSLLLDSSQPALRVRFAVEEDSPLLTDSSQSNVEKPFSLVDSSKSFIEDKKLDSSSRNPSRRVSSRSILTWYNGILGNVTVQKSSKFVGNVINACGVDVRSMPEETCIILRPSFLRNQDELHCVERFGRISRTLNVDRVVEYKDPVFEMCHIGDITGLYGAFCAGRASPDIVNPMRTGLLHVGNLLGHRLYYL